ncbi:unnamed protein product [Umbelopsis ramanniana]
MAHHTWMPLTDNADGHPCPSPPSAVHYALSAFRGSSAPPVLYRPSKPSARSTFGYFRSCKVRPASSFAESGPHSQRTWKSDHDLFAGKYRHTPASSEHNSSVRTSRRSTLNTITKELSIGQPYHYASQRTSSLISADEKTMSQHYSINLEPASEDEKRYISLKESKPSDKGHLNPYSTHESYESSRPWSFPYFLPMPLKRVLTRHTWTDYGDPESMEEEYSQYSTPPRSTDSQPFLSDTASPYADVQYGLAVDPWKRSWSETSVAPSSTRMVAGMHHRRDPTVSSLSISEASCPIVQATRNIISSQRQMIDIDAIERGYSYNPTRPDDSFWSMQTILFLFGFLAFPCWWIGAFAPSDPEILKAYNVRSSYDPIYYGSTTRHLPPSPTIVINPIQQRRSNSKSTMKKNFQQLNRVMTLVSIIVGLLVAGLLIWYKLGMKHRN